jgi:hypothetical protein
MYQIIHLPSYRTLHENIRNVLNLDKVAVIIAQRGAGISVAVQHCFSDYTHLTNSVQVKLGDHGGLDRKLIFDRPPLPAISEIDTQFPGEKHVICITTP